MAALPNLRRAIGNKISTTLSSSVTDSALSMTVADATGMDATGGYIIIDEADASKREIVYVESISGNTLTISTSGRGLAGTTGVAHDSGATVTDILVDEHINGTIDMYSVGHTDAGAHKSGSITPLNLDATLASGWIDANETWTYASAITFTISGDKTAKYSAGMKLKLTQTTAKYFFITKVEYSDPNTTITVFGGTDYTLANAAITSPYYSTQKSPHGFPMSPTKWTVSTSDTTDRSQSNPNAGTWYNLGSLSLAVPIGSWLLGYKCCLYTNRPTSTFSDSRSTLSTANNSASDATFSTYNAQSGASGTQQQYAHIQLEQYKFVDTAVSYYLNVGTPNSLGAGAEIGIKNVYETAQIYAICAYL